MNRRDKDVVPEMPAKAWSFPAKILAYLILGALAAGSVYLIDRKVPALPTLSDPQ